MISTLESYSQTLNKNALLGQTTEDILQNMYNELKTQIVFSIKSREPIFFPNAVPHKRQQLLAMKEKASEFKHEPIFIFDQHYADLTLFRADGQFSEFELLILDRTATALAQLLMREFYIEEKKKYGGCHYSSRLDRSEIIERGNLQIYCHSSFKLQNI